MQAEQGSRHGGLASMAMSLNQHLFAAVAAGFLAVTGASLALAAEKAVAPERNPPGDIPDTQVFVTYTSPLGFSIKVPEGWSRTETGQMVRFADKYNTIEVAVSSGAAPPTAATVKTDLVPVLEASGRAVKVAKIKDVKLKAGTAVLISYTSNSEPNAVTNKQIRLEHDRYLYFKDGKLAALDMAAPQGADNVDDWSLMANSFLWK
jgi:hypothetical protein